MSTFTRSAVTIGVASAALVAAALGSTTATAHAAGATAPAKAATSISIRAVHSHVRSGAHDVVTGNLHVAGDATAEGRSVTLEARAPGQDSFAPVGDAVAGDHGGLRLSVVPEVTTKYRWAYAGADDARARRSGVVTIHVRTGDGGGGHPSRLPTSLSVRAVHRLVGTDGTDTIRSTLRSRHTGLPHRLIVLLAHRSDGDGWRFVAAHRTGKGGHAAFTVHPAASTTYRTQFGGTTVFRPSRSGVAHVGVRPSVSIGASPAVVDAGGTTTLSGVVTSGGAAVVGASVKLVAHAAQGGGKAQVVGTGTTDANGAVAIAATPASDTRYRLVVAHSDGVPASVSRTVVVKVRYASSLSIRGKHTSAGYVVSGTLRGHGTDVEGATVTLLAQAPGATDYTAVGTTTTGRRGGVRFTEAEAAGTGYRLSYAGDARFAPSTSGTVVG